MFTGELISLGVAASWTATALFAEVGSKRMGSLPFNIMRMALSLLFLTATLWLVMGAPYPRFADGSTWLWMLLSGLVGYVVGDYCLMQGYIHIGSRFGQLFMTLSAPTAAITGRLLLGEQMLPLAIAGMAITLSGIALSILSKGDGQEQHALHLKLPAKGIFYAAMAGICQGFGLVLSKNGLKHYDIALSAIGLSGDAAIPDAIVPLPISITMPVAATAIRTYIGLIGFIVALLLFDNDGRGLLHRALTDSKAMWCALASTVFGPFVGVSASLLATLYTSAGIAQTLFALTPILIIAPAALLFGQRVTAREVLGAAISVGGVCLFFV